MSEYVWRLGAKSERWTLAYDEKETQARRAVGEARSSVAPGLLGLHVEISVRVQRRPEDAVGNRDAGVAPVGHNELATQRGPRLGVQQDHSAIRAADGPRYFMLEQQQVVEVVRRYQCRRSDIDQPSLDRVECWMGAELVGVGDHVVAAEPAGDDGPQ